MIHKQMGRIVVALSIAVTLMHVGIAIFAPGYAQKNYGVVGIAYILRYPILILIIGLLAALPLVKDNKTTRTIQGVMWCVAGYYSILGFAPEMLSLTAAALYITIGVYLLNNTHKKFLWFQIILATALFATASLTHGLEVLQLLAKFSIIAAVVSALSYMLLRNELTKVVDRLMPYVNKADRSIEDVEQRIEQMEKKLCKMKT